MNDRIWGIIGGVALVLALLSPLVLGSAQKVERLFESAEALYERSDYKDAIIKYKAALKESKKLGAKTERIDPDFTTLANLKIAQCYYELAEDSSDDRDYQSALAHIKKVVLKVQDPKHREELTYLWAETLYKTGDLDQAESKFLLLIEKFPKSRWVEKALYTIAEINYQQQNYDTACKTFQQLITEFPHSEFKAKVEQRIMKLKYLIDNGECSQERPIPIPEPIDETMFKSASNLKQQGRVHDAYQIYTNLITQFPDSKYVTDAYVAKADIHLDVEDYVKARANYEEAIYSTTDEERKKELYKEYHRTYLVPVYADRIKQHPSSNELFVKARLFRKEEQFLDAAEIYEQLANSNLLEEDTVYALYWTGRCYHKASPSNSNLFNKSVNAFIKLIGSYRTGAYTIEAYYYLTLAYANWAHKSGNESKWQLVIDTVEEADTKFANSNDFRNQGWLNRMQELKDEAHKKLRPLPNPLKEEAERAINTAEIVLDRAKQENRAPQLIHEANEYLANAQQEMRGNNYSTALNQAKKSIKTINSDSLPLVQRYIEEGHIYLRQGKLEKAMEKTTQAINLEPNYAPAHELSSKIKQGYYGLGWTFFDEEQYDIAIAAFKNAINIDPKFKEAHCHLGVIYIEQQRYAEAIESLKKATEIDSGFKEAHFNLALAYLKLGEFELAKNASNAALEIDPNYEPARILIEFIAD